MMQWPIPRTLAVSMLLLSLGIVGWTGYAFFKSLGDNVPSETERFAGTVRDVKHGWGRYGELSSIRFRVGPTSPEFLYVSFFPSFEEVGECLVSGAQVQLRTSRGTDGVIWELKCGLLVCDSVLGVGDSVGPYVPGSRWSCRG